MEDKVYSKVEIEKLVDEKTSELSKIVEQYRSKEDEIKMQTEALADANCLAAELVVEIEEKNEQLEDLNSELGAKSDELSDAYSRLEGSYDDLKKDQALKEIEMRRMEIELKTAQTVQAMLLPQNASVSFPGMDISTSYQPATETGGDWLGFVINKFKDKISILIGDVTGHGIGSALITAGVYAFFSTVKHLSTDILGNAKTLDTMADIDKEVFELSKMAIKKHLFQPDNMLVSLNNVIHDMGKSNIFMTFFATTVDLRKPSITASSAGHCPPIIVRKTEDGFEKRINLHTRGPRLGYSIDSPKFSTKTIDLKNEDIIFLYTDGLFENTNKEGELIKKREITKFLQEHYKLEAPVIKDKLEKKIYDFLGRDTQLDDDIAFIIAKHTSL